MPSSFTLFLSAVFKKMTWKYLFEFHHHSVSPFLPVHFLWDCFLIRLADFISRYESYDKIQLTHSIETLTLFQLNKWTCCQSATRSNSTANNPRFETTTTWTLCENKWSASIANASASAWNNCYITQGCSLHKCISWRCDLALVTK